MSIKKKRDYSKTQRTRTKCIQVRCSEEEYTKILRNANAARLSISGYIRKLALLHEMRALPPEAFYELLDCMKWIKAEMTERAGVLLGRSELKEITRLMAEFDEKVQTFYEGDNHGNNEDLGN